MRRDDDDDKMEDQGGAPKWMVTFGDALTLLLTFFVLLLTFSTSKTSNEGKLKEMARGFLSKEGGSGPRTRELKSAPGVGKARLRRANLRLSQTQFPPLYQSLDKKKLQAKAPGLTVTRMADIGKAVVIRVPVKRLFRSDGRLSDSGREVLQQIRKVMLPFPRTLVVRTRLAGQKQASKNPEKNIRYSLRVVRALRTPGREDTFEFRVSPNLRLSKSRLKAGYCHVTILRR